MNTLKNSSRQQADAECARFSGLACTWDINTENNRVRPEAVMYAIRLAEDERKQRNGVMLWPLLQEHAPDLPFGWIASAEVRTDGLYVEGFMDATTSEAKKAFQKAREGKSSGLSLGFKVLKEHREGGVRVIDALEIYEISVGELPVDLGARLKSVTPFSDLEYATMRAIQAEQRKLMSDDARRLADLRARLLADGDEEMDNHRWVDDDDYGQRPLQGGSRDGYSQYGEPDKGYRIEYGREDESRAVFERDLRAELRASDPDLYNLTPGGKAYQKEIERRQQERVAKQKAQQEALEVERRERAERQAAMSAETFTPESFAQASGLGAEWCKRWFKHIANSGVNPVDADGLVLQGQDVRKAALRDAELIETQAISMRNKRAEGGR